MTIKKYIIKPKTAKHNNMVRYPATYGIIMISNTRITPKPIRLAQLSKVSTRL